ncbi:hypothetical protein PoB_005202100 [Plakobranchus ocellatus]|uniref:Uncharacterized protein n=1 Tax=Plakobranchus ocellatus TaxID=259542 RepID=A0AAV4C2A7_9GAST|nr:hypothetical protein PoB_005202100 [Plakobranchus ocellatus]
MTFLASPRRGDLRLSGSPSSQSAGGGARTRDRGVPADFRADWLATVPSMPPLFLGENLFKIEATVTWKRNLLFSLSKMRARKWFILPSEFVYLLITLIKTSNHACKSMVFAHNKMIPGFLPPSRLGTYKKRSL